MDGPISRRDDKGRTDKVNIMKIVYLTLYLAITSKGRFYVYEQSEERAKELLRKKKKGIQIDGISECPTDYPAVTEPEIFKDR